MYFSSYLPILQRAGKKVIELSTLDSYRDTTVLLECHTTPNKEKIYRRVSKKRSDEGVYFRIFPKA